MQHITEHRNYFAAIGMLFYPLIPLFLAIAMLKFHRFELYRADVWVYFLMLLIVSLLCLEAPWDALVSMRISDKGITFSKPWKRLSLLKNLRFGNMPVFRKSSWEPINEEDWTELWFVEGRRGNASFLFLKNGREVFFAGLPSGYSYYEYIRSAYPKKKYREFRTLHEADIFPREIKSVLPDRYL